MRRTRALGRRAVLGLAALALTVALMVQLPAPATASGFPALPLEYGRQLVGNLTGPTLAPGASGSISFTIENPLGGTIEGVRLTFQVYAFNAFPGNATSTVPVAGAPVLSVPGAAGASVNVTLGSLAAGAVYAGSVGVATADGTPDGTFAVRTAISFTSESNGTAYRLESRGWFTAAAWADATEEPNGSVTLNLSRLGVSGVTPETSVLVANSDWAWVLGGILAAAVVLAGVAAWIYFRRGPRSSSGTR